MSKVFAPAAPLSSCSDTRSASSSGRFSAAGIATLTPSNEDLDGAVLIEEELRRVIPGRLRRRERRRQRLGPILLEREGDVSRPVELLEPDPVGDAAEDVRVGDRQTQEEIALGGFAQLEADPEVELDARGQCKALALGAAR